MRYHFETIVVKTNLFGNVKTDRLNEQVEERLNALADAGFEIVSVTQFASDSKHFSFNIVYRK